MDPDDVVGDAASPEPGAVQTPFTHVQLIAGGDDAQGALVPEVESGRPVEAAAAPPVLWLVATQTLFSHCIEGPGCDVAQPPNAPPPPPLTAVDGPSAHSPF